MGTMYSVTCRQCRRDFDYCDAYGMGSQILHCDGCGRSHGIAYTEVEDLFRRFRAGPGFGSRGPVPTVEGADGPIAALSQEGYEEAVEARCAPCECGGAFRFDPPIRCPRCGSLDCGPKREDGCWD